MVVTEEIVLKALVELRDSYEKTDYDIVADKLDIDFVTLGKYLESLRRKGLLPRYLKMLRLPKQDYANTIGLILKTKSADFLLAQFFGKFIIFYGMSASRLTKHFSREQS